MGLQIVTDPAAPVLRKVCTPVEKIDGAIGQLALDMLIALYHAGGRGLAAPQVSRPVRLFVTDTTWKEGTPCPSVFVNPRIVAVSDARIWAEERCLSIPDTPCNVLRPDWVDMEWQALDGSVRVARMGGFMGRCVQHELDHLDGVLCTDRAAA